MVIANLISDEQDYANKPPKLMSMAFISSKSDIHKTIPEHKQRIAAVIL